MADAIAPVAAAVGTGATALEIAAAVARGETSAQEQLQAAIDRIDRRNGPVHAIVACDYDAARQDAEAADARRAVGERPPLLGVPDGVSTTLGLVVLGYALWLEWFVVRAALALPGPTAAMVVALDLAIGLAASGFTTRIAG